MKAITAIQQKFDYVISHVQEGPLSKDEHEDLIRILNTKRYHESMWGKAIDSVLNTDEGADNSELIQGLASQCMDDIFTMVCIVGQKAVIYLLRTIEQ